jgi:hypothetical protein
MPLHSHGCTLTTTDDAVKSDVPGVTIRVHPDDYADILRGGRRVNEAVQRVMARRGIARVDFIADPAAVRVSL